VRDGVEIGDVSVGIEPGDTNVLPFEFRGGRKLPETLR
jgi:hypothetical protein